MRIGGEGTHKDGCVGWWIEVTEEMAADFFDRIEEIDSSLPPIPELHDLTVVAALDAGKPILVTFATPAFCQTRFCGPVIDRIVRPLLERYGSEAAFIHIEPFDLAEAREAGRYDGAMRGYQDAAIKTAVSLGLLNAGQAVIIVSGLVAVMAMTALEVQAGTMTVGSFVMVNAFVIQITVPLNFLGSAYREIRQALIDMREMFELIDEAPEVVDAPGARALAVGEGRVVFRTVDFDYSSDRPILREVSFDVPGGRSLAVVGPSGAGKSTIFRLIFRLYDVTGGAVEIDGQDLRDVTQASLRAAIGVVPQDTVLFNDTIGYNIAYGREGASRDEVVAAARAARIHDFIESLPEGYETAVGERGLKLSGGEKQRVAIARTILKDPPILILDEATSALDTPTEREIQAELKRLGENRTVLMIAHRLSTVVDADEIVVLDRGRVVERGTHAALLAKGGQYAEMWVQQEREEEVV